MSLDITQPLELEDGREVNVIGKLGKNSIRVMSTGYPSKVTTRGYGTFEDNDGFYYSLQTGEFLGQQGSPYYFRLVNAVRPEMYIPEDWS